MPAHATDSARTGKPLFDATVPFTRESSLRSWASIGSTLLILLAVLALAAQPGWWPLRLAASLVGGLITVRAFILYHDFMHGSLLPGSRMAQVLFYGLGLLLLTPPRHWRASHNGHHAQVGKQVVSKPHSLPVLISDIGSFPLMSTDRWKTATSWQKLQYRVSRHPLTILFAYITIFLLVSCVNPLVKDPRRYWDGTFALLAHGGLIALLWVNCGWDVALFSVVLPFAVASAMGAYLFYAQHAYEGLQIAPASEWTYFTAALESSSFMKLGRLMNWFTGNIGYHHVHHLNPRIPFYRLPEAMDAIPELRHPTATSLHPRDVMACFSANLWDLREQRMVSYRVAARADRLAAAREPVLHAG